MKENPEWNYTKMVPRRVENSSFYEEPCRESRNGRWKGRPIIGRDTPINGGVYLVGGIGEAIVVDDTVQPELLAAYVTLKQRIGHRIQSKEKYKSYVLNDVYDLVLELMPYSQAAVDTVAREMRVLTDEKVSLSSYLNAHGGVCRHQALLGAYLLEKLKNDGLVQGKVSVDRNYIPGKGGHAWIRYTNSAGEKYIIDPAQQLVDRLENISRDDWFYHRPRERRWKFFGR